jgi:hypothetical protein
MPWGYEIRGSEYRLVEIRSGFASEREARNAGKRAKRMIDCVCYPNLESLTLVIKADAAPMNRLAEMPAGTESFLDPQRIANGDIQWNLKYSWQQLVVDAFLEPYIENLPRKISVAERAISARLLERKTFALDERIALGEALLALHRLLCDLTDEDLKEESSDEEDIA